MDEEKSKTKARLIIMRHSERLDSVLRDPRWPLESFVNGIYLPSSLQLPNRLPVRSNPLSYIRDTPLTRYGKAHAFHTGQYFRAIAFFPTRVYTSPAMRCVQTADSVLDGLGQRDRSGLRMDLALHEPSRKELPLENDEFYSSAGFYIDRLYQPLLCSEENQKIIGETRFEYYRRMYFVLKRIIQETLLKSSTTLIVTHRSCVTLLAAMLNLSSIDEHVNDLYQIEINKRAEVNFLAMIIAEYDVDTGLWTFLTDFPSISD